MALIELQAQKLRCPWGCCLEERNAPMELRCDLCKQGIEEEAHLKTCWDHDWDICSVCSPENDERYKCIPCREDDLLMPLAPLNLRCEDESSAEQREHVCLPSGNPFKELHMPLAPYLKPMLERIAMLSPEVYVRFCPACETMFDEPKGEGEKKDEKKREKKDDQKGEKKIAKLMEYIASKQANMEQQKTDSWQ